MNKDEKVLRDLVEVIRRFADSLDSAIKAIYSVKDAVPETEDSEDSAKENEYTIEYVRDVLSEKSLDGQSEKVKALLLKFGHEKLSDIAPEDYPALLKEAELIKKEES